jgi:uncharacterized membrane protein HdeD (DUF308 family)
MPRTFCKVLGVVLLVVGVLGFANPRLLGMHLSPVHNVIHLVSGGVALYLAAHGLRSSLRSFCLAFGAMYLSLAVLGFVAPDVASAMIGHDAHMSARALTPDNLVHVLLGGAFLVAGLRPVRRIVRA